MKLLIKPPHIEEHHVKHSACLTIIGGTALEAAHMFYPTGLLMLMLGGIIAVYEPYIVQHVNGDLKDGH